MERPGAAAVKPQSLSVAPHWTHVYRFAWQGWLPDLFNERVARLTGVGAATPSFPFVEMHSSLEQQPPQGVIHQFVMVLVSCLHMSVAEVVMAYAMVS